MSQDQCFIPVVLAICPSLEQCYFDIGQFLAWNTEVLAVCLQSAVCLDAHGGVYSLQYEPSERGLERNMRMDMHFHCRGTGVRILPGTRSQLLPLLCKSALLDVSD